jgi:hypothetical protein
LTREQLEAKRAKEKRERAILDSRAKSARSAARKRKAKLKKKANHRKTRIMLGKRGRRANRPK